MSLEGSTEVIARWRGALSFGWLVILLAWETVAPCFALFRSWRERGGHALVNFILAALNVLAVLVVFAGLWKATADWAAAHHFGLWHRLPLPSWAQGLAAVLSLDVWTYGWHRANHRLPFLWRFHRVHHSDAWMDVTTANRFHFGEIILSAGLRLLVIPLLGIRFRDLVMYETLLQIVVQWHHANIALPAWLERILRSVIVTPGLHKVHHSREAQETDSNYSSLLSVWDRAFRSLRTRTKLDEIQLGLSGFDGPERQTLKGLVQTPFRP